MIVRRGAGADNRRVIRIQVGSSAEAFDLRESLARRGIQGTLAEAGAAWEVEIDSPREEPGRLLHDVAEGVEAWRAGRAVGGIVARLVAEPSLLP